MTETRALRLIAVSPDNNPPFPGVICCREHDHILPLVLSRVSHAEGLAAHPTRMGSSSSPKDARPARTSPGAPGALQPQAARSRLRNNSILTQVPVLWAHLAAFGHRGPPPQMRLLCTAPVLVSPCGIARCEEPGLEPACTLSTSGSLLPCPGAPEHPHGSPTACTEGRAAPWEPPHVEQLVPPSWELRVQPGADPAAYRAAGCQHSPVPKPPSPCPSHQRGSEPRAEWGPKTPPQARAGTRHCRECSN